MPPRVHFSQGGYGADPLLSSASLDDALAQHAVSDPLDQMIFDEYVDGALFEQPALSKKLHRVEMRRRAEAERLAKLRQAAAWVTREGCGESVHVRDRFDECA